MPLSNLFNYITCNLSKCNGHIYCQMDVKELYYVTYNQHNNMFPSAIVLFCMNSHACNHCFENTTLMANENRYCKSRLHFSHI